MEVMVARSKKGQAISSERRTIEAITALKIFLAEAKKQGNLDEWRRAKAILGYINGTSVIQMASDLDVKRNTINIWLRWYETGGVDSLRNRKRLGPAPKLTKEQLKELGDIIDAGPLAAGYESGMWTGPMVGDLIEQRFSVRYHNHHVPRLLHQLGFSVQRPRKRLARADAEAQARWLWERLPKIKKRPQPAVES